MELRFDGKMRARETALQRADRRHIRLREKRRKRKRYMWLWVAAAIVCVAGLLMLSFIPE